MRRSRVAIAGLLAVFFVAGCDRTEDDLREFNLRLVLTDSLLLAHPSWSPDGKKLAFTRMSGHQLQHGGWETMVSIIDVASAEVTHLSPSGVQEQFPEWSPEGDKISFERWDGTGAPMLCYSVAFRDISTKSLTYFRTGRRAVWSGTGDRLLFLAPGTEDNCLWKVPAIYTVADAVTKRSIPDANYGSEAVAWSPRDDRIASLAMWQGGGASISTAIMTFTPTNLVPVYLLNRSGIYEVGTSLSWSPHGEWITFSYSESPGHPLRVTFVNADSKELFDLTPGEDPAWSPDSKHVAYVVNNYATDVYELWIAENVDRVLSP